MDFIVRRKDDANDPPQWALAVEGDRILLAPPSENGALSWHPMSDYIVVAIEINVPRPVTIAVPTQQPGARLITPDHGGNPFSRLN